MSALEYCVINEQEPARSGIDRTAFAEWASFPWEHQWLRKTPNVLETCNLSKESTAAIRVTGHWYSVNGRSMAS